MKNQETFPGSFPAFTAVKAAYLQTTKLVKKRKRKPQEYLQYFVAGTATHKAFCQVLFLIIDTKLFRTAGNRQEECAQNAPVDG